MSGSSLLALALRDKETEQGSEKEKLREQIAKGNVPTKDKEEEIIEADPDKDKDEVDIDVKIDEDEDDEADEDKDKKEELTPEQIKDKEAKEKIEAKAKRKYDRMQARIDEAVAERGKAQTEIARLKAQLEADPEKKLTPEEIESRADAIVAKKLADKDLLDLQTKFDAACNKLQKDARKVEGNNGKNFDTNVEDMAEQFGPIPSFMIGVLEDFDNGAEVLAHIAADEEIAENIYNLKNRPAKMTKELVLISNKLIEAKKPARRQISKVPDPVDPVSANRVVSTTITEADTKDMNSYVAKRRAQQEAAKKAKGW